ncbi:hypothetical protein LCGC14_2355760 [marine sediment metagenome]|uniref:Uncharacterized protein n=1 Tax=marine sediment metagenome TaxID=412755 RepID=A0A0F9C8E4_9ZZZZ
MDHEERISEGALASGGMRFKVLLIILLLLVVSIIVILNLFFYQSYEAEMASQINAQQIIIAKTIVLSIDSTMEHLKEEVVSLAGLLSERGLDKGGLDDFVQYAFEELNEDIRIDIVIFDTRGSVLLSTNEAYSMSDEDLGLYAGSSSLPPSQVNMLPGGDNFLELKVITPIRRRSDLLGAIMMIINIDDFNRKFIAPIKVGERGHAWVMDEEGTLIYHPTMPEMVGRNIRTPSQECFECHISFNAERQILESPDVGFSSYVAPYGEDKLLAFARASQIGWIVFVSVPYSEVTASIKNSMRLQSLLVIIIFISTLAVAFIMIMINRQRLRAEAPGAVLDDHTRWRRPLVRAAQSLNLLGLASIGLIVLTMAAMITLAANVSLTANAQVIGVLRLVGARDTYIARAFVRRFTLRALGGAAGGAALGMVAVALLPDTGSAGAFLTGLGFSGFGWLAPLTIPPLAGAIAFWATRHAAFRALKEVT